MKTVCIKTLGCKVNAYESEFIISLFLHNDYLLVEEKADIYVINTCTVTNESDKKSRKTIHNLRKNNPNSIIIVIGCYIQNLYNKNKLSEIIPYADIILGNKDKSKIIEYLNEFIKSNKQIIKFYDIQKVCFEDMEINHLHNHTRGFVKIEDGCNNYCNYCIIPYVRGCVRSKNKDIILEEVNRLVKNNTKEIVLTGIHTGQYGRDLNDYDLFSLLLDLIEIKHLKRIRISSIEVVEINDRIISILSNSSVANHLHIPLQSGCDKILKLMNRRYNTEYFQDKIITIRNILPNISITTDVIVGYPGETEDDFIETYNFCKKIKFSKIHVFPYSDREGTIASKIKEKVNPIIKKERVEKLLSLSEDLKNEYEKNFYNKEESVLIETYKEGYYYGYTSNYLYLKLEGNYNLNEIYKVKIDNINTYII